MVNVFMSPSVSALSRARVLGQSRTLTLTLTPRILSSHPPYQSLILYQIRSYASKNKNKNSTPNSTNSPATKGSHASTTKNLIPASERAFLDEAIQSEYDKTSEKMSGTVEWMRKEVAAIIARGTGHVSTSILDGVRVSVKADESRTEKEREVRLNEIATVGVRDGNCILLTLHDDEYFKPVEKAIYAAKIPSVVPQKIDGRTIKIVIPRPTMEVRAALLQVAAKTAEEARVQLRKSKDTIVRKYKWKPKAEETEQFQKLCDSKVKEVDNILNKAKQEFGK